MAKSHDLIEQIINTATAIAERAAAIPIGDEPVYLLELELVVALERLQRTERDMDNLTEDDTRNDN